MRVMISSFWASPEDEPLTVVLRDSDVVDSLESARESILERTSGKGYCHFDIFTMFDADSIAATAKALQRRDPEREADMALLFFWAKGALRAVKPGGSLVTTRPAPLSVEDLHEVLAQVVTSDAYRDQNIHTISADHRYVTVKAGEVVYE